MWILRRYAAEHEWIELLRTPERKERHFAGKVQAFNFGYESVKGLNYDFIGSLGEAAQTSALCIDNVYVPVP